MPKKGARVNAVLDDDGDEDTSSLEDLVHHFDVDTTADDYVNADDGLDTNLTFEDSDNWREELRSMACDENPSPSKQTRVEVDEDNEDDEEDEPERSSITSYDVALRLSSDLIQFLTQNKGEAAAGAMLNVITLLEGAKVNMELKRKQSSLLDYFNKT